MRKKRVLGAFVAFISDNGTTIFYVHLIINIKRLIMKVLVPFHATLGNFKGSTKLPDGADFRNMPSPISILQPPLFLAATFHYRICSKSMASLQTASPLPLPLGFPIDLLPPNILPLFLGIRRSPVLTTYPANCSLQL